MSPNDKKQMIATFYRSGGKKAGLTSIFKQHVSIIQLAAESEWSGYVTPAALLKLHTVCPEKKNSTTWETPLAPHTTPAPKNQTYHYTSYLCVSVVLLLILG